MNDTDFELSMANHFAIDVSSWQDDSMPQTED